MKTLAFALSLALCAPALAQSDKPPETEKPALPRTNPKMWSKHGWQGLKWGMGPGDVKTAMKLTDFKEHVDDQTYQANYPGGIFGISVKSSFFFTDDKQLFAIMLQPQPVVPSWLETDNPKGYEEEVCIQWYSEVFNALKLRYGEPTCKGGRHVTCEFRKPSLGLFVSHYVHPVTACSFLSGVSYQNLSAVERREALEKQREIDKL